MKKNYTFLIVLLMLIFVTGTARLSASAMSEDTTLQARSTFPIGAYITTKYLDNNQYVNRAVDEFGSVTIGAMKMKVVCPNSSSYDFSIADSLVDFAQGHGKRIHAHTLIWGSVPDWVTNFVGDSVAWENLMKNYIQTLVTRYKGKVASWDVVNEAIDDNGNIKTDNIWCQHLGSGYIERAFIYAHEADSNVLLFYNDYGHEYSNTRLNAIVSMLNDFKTRGIPVHGIGMQMHTRYNLGDDRWKNAINSAASTGLKVHISELDISLNPDMDTSFVYTPELGEIQKQKFRYIVQAYLAIPDSQKYGITTWGVGDNDSWKKIAYPLVFDNNYLKKPAYYGILDSFDRLSETSLFFSTSTTGYPSKYSFNTGDNLYLGQGRNTSINNVCAGKEGISRTYRVQEHTFVIELNSTSMDSICIYGCGTSNNSRNISKVEISTVSKDGPFTDITNSVSIGEALNTTSCGKVLSANGINALRGSYVKFTISLVSDTSTRAAVNISELLIIPVPVGLYFNTATTSYPSKYTFNSGDALYLSQGRNTSTNNVCNGRYNVSRNYRIQEHTFVLELNSTSMDSLILYGCGTSNNERNFSKVEISDVSKDGPFTNITNTVNIGSSINSTTCANNITVGNINAKKGSYVKLTISLISDTTTRASVNISELSVFPYIVNGTGQQQVVSRNITDNNINISSNKAIKSKEYYTIMGNEVDNKAKGLIIEKVTFEDGSILTSKVFKLN